MRKKAAHRCRSLAAGARAASLTASWRYARGAGCLAARGEPSEEVIAQGRLSELPTMAFRTDSPIVV
jgi:hypothetical protein